MTTNQCRAYGILPGIEVTIKVIGSTNEESCCPVTPIFVTCVLNCKRPSLLFCCYYNYPVAVHCFCLRIVFYNTDDICEY